MAKDSPVEACPLRAVVCQGPHCRGKAQTRLCDALDAAGVDVCITRCMGVCKGPVAMLSIEDRWEVVKQIRTKRSRRRVVAALKRQRRADVRKRIVGGGRRERAIVRGTSSKRRVA